MTDKKERILDAALELFANEGYNATPTSKIAKEAEVSEGLIFRHFGNKKGLLEAIMKEAGRKLEIILRPIFQLEDPKDIIRETLLMPFRIEKGEYDFWKLQFKLKWQKEYDNPIEMNPLIVKLAEAFAALGVDEPANEAILLNQILEAISIELLKGKLEEKEDYKDFLLRKYNL